MTPVPGFLGRILDDTGAPEGTCFQVAPGVLVTAAHVLDGLGKAAPGAAVGVDLLSGGDAFGAHVVAVDATRDLAVLRAAREFPATVAGFAATDTVPARAEVTMVAACEVDDDHTYRYMTATGTWQGSTVRDDVLALGRFTSSDVLRGMSGAPVWQADGLVVGVLSGRYNSADGWLAHSAWVSGTEYLAELLSGLTTLALLDVSTPAVRWRARRAEFLDAMTRLARDQPDSFLVDDCGPPLIPAFVRKPGDGDRKAARERIPAADLLAMSGDCVLTGGPGAGKSRLLRSWTVGLATDAVRVPVLLRAGDLVAAAGSPIGPVGPVESLAAAVGTALGSVGHSGLPWLAEWFTSRPAAEVEWVVLVDGLDEVADDRLRDRVFSVLAALHEEPGWQGRVVVASRPSTTDGSAGGGWPHDRYDLTDFDDAQRDEFVLRYFAALGLPDPERAARDFVADLHRRGLHQLARIPLMLVILTQLFHYDSARTLPASRVDAYVRIVEKTHRRRSRGSGVTSELHDWHDENLAAALETLHDRLGDLDGLLSRLAFERFLGRADSAVDWISARTGDLRGTTRLSADHWRVVVREALRHNRLLVAHGHDFEFVHATLHEFFAARHLARDRRLSKELLHLVVGRRGERVVDMPVRHGSLEYGHHFPFTDWVFAFWSDWRPFSAALLRLIKRDPLTGCVFVAFLSWRWVRLDPEVLAVTRENLRALPAGSLTDDDVSIPDLQAMVGDPAGFAALTDAVRDPRLGFGRMTAAKKLITLGDPRGPDLLAEATEAVVTAPEPSRFTDTEAEARRHAAQDLARRGHPDAPDLLRRFLLDPRTDDGRTRRYTYAMLDYDPDPHTADLVAYLMTEVPASDNADEHYRRSECVKILLGMTDPGCADRFARMASASATMPHAARARAAVLLADLGDPRAAELLAGLTETTDTDDFDELEVRQDVAWALVRLGDRRAIEPLITVAAHTPPIWLWWRQVRTAAKNGNPATADMLVAMAGAPDLPPEHRCEILLWLTLNGEPRGIEGAVRAASDPGMTPSLRTLADGLARRRDRRFVTLLTRWVDSLDDVWHTDEDRRWATRVLASPEEMLGDGLNADYVTAQEIGPSGRFRLIEDLFTKDHPRAMDCLLAMYHDFEARDDVDDDHNSTLYHVVNMLAARDSLVAVPRLAARVRDTDRYDGSEALKALTKLDGQVVADTLVALAPHIVSTDQRTLAHKLLDMDDPRVGGLLAGWTIAETRRYPFDGVDWRLDRLRERHDPHLVTVYEHLMDQHLSGRGRLRPRRAIHDLAEVGGPHEVELLTRWAADPRLTEEDRATVAHVLATSEGEPVPEVRESVSELEYLFRYYART